MSSAVHIRESQIEDILVMYPEIAAHLLHAPADITPIARQKWLPSGGRLDIVYVSGSKFLLVELKVESYKPQFLNQVITYRHDLLALQAAKEFPQGEIEAFLLVPKIDKTYLTSCAEKKVIAIEYSPDEVLAAFHERMSTTTKFLSLKPVDHGIWNIHLISKMLWLLDHGTPVSDLNTELKLAARTLSNRIRFAFDLHLVNGVSGRLQLTDRGREYVAAHDKDVGFDKLSEGQAQVLRDLIVKSPYLSPAIFGIYSVVDSVFTLARNTYPVLQEILLPFYRDAVGKHFEWQTPKAMLHGVRMYSNYAIDLGLLGKVGDKFYLTPSGTQFILLLQLHKSINVIDAIRLLK